ncbi:hypothetical protein B0A55_04539 [Friedmanniomyces simplex]|uniref:Uncharacterized protein n=1 Tax=Friedmanniomyces simplex TaxID=329884 RepID=A0A4U0XUI8_9PEZI|nr:hypothetical protein B0A55_04539 [Friedmanniomyces simplex]
MFRGEVGWSKEYAKRAETQKRLYATSPAIFRLAQCVLQAIFLQKGFKMHQFALFEIVRPEEAGIAESIGSHLAAAYVKYGGFNVDTAGVTSTRILKKKDVDWVRVSNNAQRWSYFRHFHDNLQARQAQMEVMRADLAYPVSSSLVSGTAVLEQRLVPIRTDLNSLDNLYREMKANAQKEEKAERALRELIGGLQSLNKKG